MKILLDENVPRPLHDVLRHLLRGHEVDHVGALWPGKKDVQLLHDAAGRYEMIVTNDIGQYDDPEECRAIRQSRLHHVTYALPLDGLEGLALACGAICAALRGAVRELEGVREQRIVRITSLDKSRKRYAITDPRSDPPSAYWT